MSARIRSALTPLALALSFFGCAVGPDYERPASPLPESWKEAIPSAAAEASMNVEWWKFFGYATLNGLVDQALVANEDLRAAVARM